ncbi:MAG TPA: ATP-binding protein [Thermoleophilaceae bacterium]|jgi:signal transduction histidine kinase
MRRLPLRLRLTLAFGLVMALVLAATGFVVYGIFRSDLNHTIDNSLRARAAATGPARGLAGEGENFAQRVRPDGSPLAATAQVRGRLLLGPADAARAARGPVFVEHAGIPGLDGRLRMLAQPEGPRILVVGQSLGERDDSLRTLALLLAGGGAVALLLACLAGYGVASGALRPVEAMRHRAAAISGARAGERLPVPDTADELQRLAETLNEMLDRLEGALARERAFVADASHELRTPLAVLKAEIDLALRRGRSADELRAALESAGEETDRLVQLAEDLLVIARVDEGRLQLRVEDLQVGELLGAVAARFGVVAGDARELRVRGDRARLEQALGNLVDNAQRHGAGEVRLSAVARDGKVELHVTDEGDGLPSDFAPLAFERFTRADAARSREASGGAGLGLAIVAAIAQSHGGSAGASGADLWIQLPALNERSTLRSTPPLTVSSSTVPTPRR